MSGARRRRTMAQVWARAAAAASKRSNRAVERRNAQRKFMQNSRVAVLEGQRPRGLELAKEAARNGVRAFKEAISDNPRTLATNCQSNEE